jgi:hypothetical protein
MRLFICIHTSSERDMANSSADNSGFALLSRETAITAALLKYSLIKKKKTR